MRTPIVVGVAAVALAVGAGGATAGKKLKLKANLSCGAFSEDGTRMVFGGKQAYRLEQAITCLVVPTSIVDGVELSAAVWTRYSRWDDAGKKIAVTGPRHTAAVAYSADLHRPALITLAPEGAVAADASRADQPPPAPDFEACLDFTVHAEVRDPAGAVVWKSKLAIKQDCPD